MNKKIIQIMATLVLLGGCGGDGGSSALDADATPRPVAGSPAEPPPPGARTVKVTLKPLESGHRWVSFGLPMPAGVLADAANLRVRFDGGAEIPAFVRALAPWRAIPPVELRCDGYTPAVPGIRSMLVQFQADITAGSDIELAVDVGKGVTGARLGAGTDVRSTYRVFDDPGALYTGAEGFLEPAVYAAIDPAWLRCTGIGLVQGPADVTPALTAADKAQKDFFYTSIADYRSAWDAPPGSWTVDPVNGPNLVSAEDSVWLYQRAQTFWGLYLRTGMFDALRAAHQAFWHYQSLIYSAADCAAVPEASKKWCMGFFKLKNPDPASPFKDAKYSYSEDFATYYWLTGDDAVLPYFGWINSALKLAIPNLGWTERFIAYGLSAAVEEYEVTGSAAALADAARYVDDLVARQARPGSDGTPNPGCIIGNNEWGVDGFSPWMSPMLMQQALRYYEATGDARVPPLLAKQATCIRLRGMAVSDGTGASALAGMLIPFYGARITGAVVDVDRNFPLAGVEHSINVAHGLALGYLFETDIGRRQALKDAILGTATSRGLLASAEWDFANWTRLTPGLPKFRLAPWRKYNWWFRHAGVLQWALFERPSL